MSTKPADHVIILHSLQMFIFRLLQIWNQVNPCPKIIISLPSDSITSARIANIVNHNYVQALLLLSCLAVGNAVGLSSSRIVHSSIRNASLLLKRYNTDHNNNPQVCILQSHIIYLYMLEQCFFFKLCNSNPLSGSRFVPSIKYTKRFQTHWVSTTYNNIISDISSKFKKKFYGNITDFTLK